MRDAFAREEHAMAQEDPRVLVVVADISPASSIAPLIQEFPRRFVNVGVAEQAMIGMCAGLALTGFRPFAYTIAPFAVYRPFEQVRDDLCYQGLPVTVVGVGGGVQYSLLGGTHHPQEDIAVMSALPGMTVVAPCDPAEVREATRACLELDGPCYLRLGKAGEPDLTAAAEPFRIGKIRVLQRGEDVCVLGYGSILRLGVELARRLESEGRSVTVASAHTVKPLDADGVAELLRRHSTVVVLEEHVPHGGLGSRVKEIAWDTGAPCRLLAFSLRDEFVHVYGSYDWLLAAHGLDLETLAAAIRSA